MQKYRLKKEVREFFKDKFSTDIYSLETWRSYTIPEEILELVPKVHIIYGNEYITSSGTKVSSLKGCSGPDKEAKFHFTIVFSDITFNEYDEVDVAEVMDEIQQVLNRRFNR